jgi:hypothetical protein
MEWHTRGDPECAWAPLKRLAWTILSREVPLGDLPRRRLRWGSGRLTTRTSCGKMRFETLPPQGMRSWVR